MKPCKEANMELEELPFGLTVCKVASMNDIDLDDDILFIGKTDEELSLVCTTKKAPAHAIEREDGWRGFRIRGTLDFSLIGVLSKISTILADSGIGIFVVSTYNTDYILVKEENREKAAQSLVAAGYNVA